MKNLPPTSRRRRLIQMGAMASGLLLVAAACASSGGGSGSSDKTIRIAYQVIPNSAPIVKHEGWLEKEKGLKVEWRQFDSGSDVNQAVAAGAVDVGLAGSTLVANGIAAGLKYQVPWIYDVIGANEGLVVQKDAGINSIKDLAGKKVATPLGSTTQYSLVEALKKNGVDPDSVKILDLKPPDALAAWSRGAIDAAYIWHPTLQKMIDSGGKVLVDSGQLAEQGVVTADLAIVATAFGEEHPELVTAWLKAENRGAKMIQDDPEKAAKIVAEEFAIKQEEALNQMKDLVILNGSEQITSKYLGTPGSPGDMARVLRGTAIFLKENKIIDSVPDEKTFQDALNSSYLQKAIGE